MQNQIREEFKRAVADGGRALVARGLTVGTWGNLSFRDPASGLVYIKPSGMPYETIEPEDIVVLDAAGRVVDGKRKPSVEFHLHLAILNARPDLAAVLHTHPLYSSVFGALGEEIPAISEDFAQLIGERAPCSVYALPGTEELARNVVAALGAGRVVILPNHGAVCVGKSLNDAMNVAAVLEKTAHIYLLARSIGTPRVIDARDVALMQDFMRNDYGQRG